MNFGMGRYAASTNDEDVTLICTLGSIFVIEKRTGCISLFPVQMVKGVLLDAPITPTMVPLVPCDPTDEGMMRYEKD